MNLRSNCLHLLDHKESKGIPEKHLPCFIDYAKAFDCVDHNKLIEMGIPDHLTGLLRNLYEGQEATVRTLYGTTDWFKIEKGVQEGCLLSPCLFNLYTECMRNAELDELQARIRMGGGSINNLRYADDTTLMVESEEELRKRVKSRLKTIKKLRLWHLAPPLHGK